MVTALISHEDGLGHITPEGHPEQVARLGAVLRAISDFALRREEAPLAGDDVLRLCHPQRYIDRISGALPKAGLARLDEDTWMSAGSLNAARRAVGGILRAVDMVLDGEAGNAFCAMRPPGHHAERETPMGFCLFGTAALAARYALERRGLSRVAVVDFDVHHGNGTQDLLWDEPHALFIGSHQMPLWPGSGAADETGGHDNVLNLPLPVGSGGSEMRELWEGALERLEAFAPQLLIISAGFDAHRDDPLAQLNWDEADFTWITRALCDLAARVCGGHVVSTLEGGYDLKALGACVRAHVAALMEAGA